MNRLSGTGRLDDAHLGAEQSCRKPAGGSNDKVSIVSVIAADSAIRSPFAKINAMSVLSRTAILTSEDPSLIKVATVISAGYA
jgi:hypothetical protein